MKHHKKKKRSAYQSHELGSCFVSKEKVTVWQRLFQHGTIGRDLDDKRGREVETIDCPRHLGDLDIPSHKAKHAGLLSEILSANLLWMPNQ